MGEQPISWAPTAEQRKKFEDREVELCLLALRRDPHLKQNQSLFSMRTWERAMRERAARMQLVP